MLALGIQKGQYIILNTKNGKIKIQLFNTSEIGNFRIAIDAPKDVEIVRGENWEVQHPEDSMSKHISKRVY